MNCRVIIALFASASLVGCAANGPSEFKVAPGDYTAAFSACRETLRDHRFELERIDASEGVITTLPKHSSGMFTPWDTEQSTVRAEIDDTINYQSRRVRVTFEPNDADSQTERTARVEVVVYRMQDYSLRPNVRTISLSSRALDPQLSERGVWPQYEVATTRDPALASRLVRDIEKRMATERAASPAPVAAPAQ